MTSGEDWLLDRVLFKVIRAGYYSRVHSATVGTPPVPTDPKGANPYSKARLALSGQLVAGAPNLGMFYVATSPEAALLEALLRIAKNHGGRRLSCRLSLFPGQRLSILRLKKDLPVIAVGLPDRTRVATTPVLDARWRELINTADHSETHVAAFAVYQQVVANGETHTGLMWPSVQAPGANVFLLYDPPLDPNDWDVVETIALDTPIGQARIAAWLASAGITWLGDPTGPGYDPIPGAL